MSDRNNRKNQNRTIRNLIVSVMVVLFFVTIIIVYYLNLYSATKNNIYANVRFNGLNAVDKINKYLYIGMDDVLLTSYTLDNMITEGRSQEEILDYLIDQSSAVTYYMSENTTGMYGYINGEFLDGAGWVPEEGYEPTERPWYTEAMADMGNLVIVDPYLDANTHSIIITLAKTLCDNQSVVAVDIDMVVLQGIVEDTARESDCDIELILDQNGQVVAHSDSTEVGNRYIAGQGTLGSAIVEGMKDSVDGFFPVTFDGKEYTAYMIVLDNDWPCLSLIESSKIIRQLRRPFMLTLIASVMVMIIVVLILINSSKQAELAREMSVKTEKAIAASEAKSAFLSNMSHEIRTPINAVLGMNEMILRECEDSGVIPYSESIKTAGNTLLGIVNDILDFSKIEAGKLEILPSEYDLSSVINDLVSMLKTRADDKGLELILDFDRNVPKQLFGDEVRIKQIITNILTNAIKYTEKGSITFKIGFGRLGTDPSAIMLDVSVKDTGIGIKDEDMLRLFSEFERIDEERNRNIEGTGLGMSITKRLLNMMGSSLKVKSVYGEGSEFYFSVKQRVIDWAPLGDYKSTYFDTLKKREKYREKFVAPGACVLVVDDNSVNLTVIKSLLKKTQVRIETAQDGDTGIAMSMKEKYDMIFLDHMMPGKDGIETLRELRSKADCPNADTPVICLTANAISGAREQYIAEGFDDYLTKPIDSSKLEDMMIRFIADDKIEITNASSETEDRDIYGLSAVLNDTDRVDLKEGLKNNGSYEDYLNALRVFYESIGPSHRELSYLYDINDLKGYTVKVHALKSSARIIGAVSLSEMAQKLENAGKEGDEEYISRNHAGMMSEYEGFGDLLKGLFENESEPEKPVADTETVKAAYEKIKSAAEEMDYDRIEKVLEDMEKYGIPEEETGLWNDVKDASMLFDYDRIIELLTV